MGITIDQPYYLIGIPVLLALLAFSAKWFRMKQKGRRRLILALHGLAMVCLVLALCGIHVQKVSDTETTIFLLDVSDSMSAQESERVEFVQKAILPLIISFLESSSEISFTSLSCIARMF